VQFDLVFLLSLDGCGTANKIK